MKKFSLIAVFFTTCVDSLSWAIVFPIFAPFFLSPESTVFSDHVSMETRTTILCFFLAAFSLGQFIGAPLIGSYADSHGRKKALLITVFMTICGMSLSAWGIQSEDLPLLFIGRLLTGFFAANLTVCLSCITDLDEAESERVRYFGYLSVIIGVSFLLGAFLGGKLSDATVHPSFTPQLPLWLAAGFSAVNFLFVLFGFRETNVVIKEEGFSFFSCINNIKQALQTKQIKRIYLVYFLFLFAWTILFQFIPVLMVRSFSFTSSNLGDLALLMGICWALGSGYFSKVFLRFISPMKVLEIALLVFPLLCIVLSFVMEIYEVLGVIAVCVLLGGMAWPLCNGLISSTAPREMQGKVLGVSQSVQSLAMALAPSVGGLAYQVFNGLPFLVGAFASLLAGILYFISKKSKDSLE